MSVARPEQREHVFRTNSCSLLRQYFYVLRGYRSRVVLMIALFFTVSLLDLMGIALVGPFIAAVSGQVDLYRLRMLGPLLQALGLADRMTAIAVFGGALIVIYLAKAAFGYRILRRAFAFGFSFRADLAMKLCRAYLSMPYRFYVERHSANLIQSVVNNTKTLADDLVIPSLRMISDGIVIVMILILLYLVNPSGTAVAVLLLGGSLALYALFVRPRARLAGANVNLAHEQTIKGVGQTAASIKEIRTFGVERLFLDRIGESVALQARASTNYFSIMMLPRFMMEAVVVILMIVLSLFTLLQGTGDVVPGLAMFAAAGLRLLPALVSMSSAAASIHYATHALDGIAEDLRFVERHALVVPEDSPKAKPAPFSVLAFEHVDFFYPGSEAPALYDVSFKIRRGQSVGIIGASGAGKSTLVDMILGFHDRDRGRIAIDGMEIEHYGWRAWREQIAYLPQNVALIDDTITANVAFGLPPASIDRDKLRRAIDAAQLRQLVDCLPDGLNTVVGERGVRLSGGERQRIALARGFYFDRDVFILDEATSALDAETERQVMETIERLSSEKTLIVIAHRLTTVRGCDIIYRLDAGRIVDSGPFGAMV